MGLFDSVRERLESLPTGFRMDEVMSGYHEFEPGCGPEGKWPMRFVATWGVANALRFFNPASEHYGEAKLDGVVTVGGLCSEVHCHGTLLLAYFSDFKIRYEFEFEADGKPYLFVGEKVNIKPWNLPVSHTTCFGTLTEADSGKLVSRSVTFFRLQHWAKFAATFRPVTAAER